MHSEQINLSTATVAFSEESLQVIGQLIAAYPEGKQKSALLPVLHMAQKELGGWLSTPVMDYVARLLHIHPVEVYEVATFYSMFHTKPVGKVLIEVCQTSPCCLNGAEELISHICNRLHIKVGETTPDGMFTLHPVECLGACGYAPMFQVGETFYEHLTLEKADELIESFRSVHQTAGN